MSLIKTGIRAGNVSDGYVSTDNKYIYYNGYLFLSRYGIGEYYLTDAGGNVYRSLTPYDSDDDTLIYCKENGNDCITLFECSNSSAAGGYFSKYEARGQRYYEGQIYIPDTSKFASLPEDGNMRYEDLYIKEAIYPFWQLDSYLDTRYRTKEKIDIKDEGTIVLYNGSSTRTYTIHKNKRVTRNSNYVYSVNGNNICIGQQIFTIEIQYQRLSERKTVNINLVRNVDKKGFTYSNKELTKSSGYFHLTNHIVDNFYADIKFDQNVNFLNHKSNRQTVIVTPKDETVTIEKATVYLKEVSTTPTKASMYIFEAPRYFNYE